jgi:hypothetical protein
MAVVSWFVVDVEKRESYREQKGERKEKQEGVATALLLYTTKLPRKEAKRLFVPSSRLASHKGKSESRKDDNVARDGKGTCITKAPHRYLHIVHA